MLAAPLAVSASVKRLNSSIRGEGGWQMVNGEMGHRSQDTRQTTILQTVDWRLWIELQTKVPEDYVKMEDITNMEQKASARVFFAYWHFHISHGK